MSLMEKVGGRPANTNPALQHSFQAEVANLLGRKNTRQFPGAQPVSFAHKHIAELKERDYYVCEKTDGIRYLMYLTHTGEPGGPTGDPCHYLIDRRNDYYYIENLYFPHHERRSTIHIDTLLDGELVEDRMPDGRSVFKFLVFDLLVIDGKDMRERTLDKRLAYLKEFILKPRNKWLAENPEARRSQAFQVEDKKTEFSYALERMFHEIIPQVKQLHGNDGLIFTCKGTEYVSGTDPHILKWKPPEENTIDFLLHINWAKLDGTDEDDYDAQPDRALLLIYVGNTADYSYVDDLYLEAPEWDAIKALNRPVQDSIVECYLQEFEPASSNDISSAMGPTKRWRFHRFRDDKIDANHSSTYDSVADSIRDHITQDDLLAHADEIRSAWKAREARSRQASKV